jgi:hypothetical protein
LLHDLFQNTIHWDSILYQQCAGNMDGPYDGAAERRRLKRRQLEEQLRLLDEEERCVNCCTGSIVRPR